MKAVYVCSDTVTGIFSAVYDAWKSGRGEGECEIAIKGMLDQELFCEYYPVEEAENKARAVERLIRKYLGQQAYWDIWHAALSSDREKGDAILGTMLAAKSLRDSTKIMEHLSHPKVSKVSRLSLTVGGEAHSFKGFARFRELMNGVLYCEITPKNQVLTCLAPHFADRLPGENWMIYDKTHKLFAVHEAGKQWVLVKGEELNVDAVRSVSEKEAEYARLWKGFCRSIAIESRRNPRCQMQHLPLRYRPDMTEWN